MKLLEVANHLELCRRNAEKLRGVKLSPEEAKKCARKTPISQIERDNASIRMKKYWENKRTQQ